MSTVQNPGLSVCFVYNILSFLEHKPEGLVKRKMYFTDNTFTYLLMFYK